MNKKEYLKELTELLEAAYEAFVAAEKNTWESEYYKGRFHAFNTAILILGQEA